MDRLDFWPAHSYSRIEGLETSLVVTYGGTCQDMLEFPFKSPEKLLGVLMDLALS